MPSADVVPCTRCHCLSCLHKLMTRVTHGSRCPALPSQGMSTTSTACSGAAVAYSSLHRSECPSSQTTTLMLQLVSKSSRRNADPGCAGSRASRRCIRLSLLQAPGRVFVSLHGMETPQMGPVSADEGGRLVLAGGSSGREGPCFPSRGVCVPYSSSSARRRALYIATYLLFPINVLVGVLAGLWRMLISGLYNSIHFCQLDISLLHRGVETFDPGRAWRGPSAAPLNMGALGAPPSPGAACIE